MRYSDPRIFTGLTRDLLSFTPKDNVTQPLVDDQERFDFVRDPVGLHPGRIGEIAEIHSVESGPILKQFRNEDGVLEHP